MGMVVFDSEVKPFPRVVELMFIWKPLASGRMPLTDRLRRSSRKVLVRPRVPSDMPVELPCRVTWLPMVMKFALRRRSQGRVCWPPTITL